MKVVGAGTAGAKSHRRRGGRNRANRVAIERLIREESALKIHAGERPEISKTPSLTDMTRSPAAEKRREEMRSHPMSAKQRRKLIGLETQLGHEHIECANALIASIRIGKLSQEVKRAGGSVSSARTISRPRSKTGNRLQRERMAKYRGNGSGEAA